MWQLLKVELSYNRLVLGIAFGFVIFMALLGINRIDKLEWIPWLPFFIAFVAMNGTIQKEKRNRFLSQLPVKRAQIATSRITLLYLIYFGIAVFWFPPFMKANDLFVQEDAWATFASSMMLIVVFAAALIFQDLKNSREGSLRNFWITAAGYTVLIVLLFYIVIKYSDQPDAPLLFRFIADFPVIPVVAVLPIPLLYFVSIATFVRRKSYLDEGSGSCGIS